MENFLVCLNAVLPIFIFILVGYISRAAGIIKEEDISRFNKLAFNVFLSANVFNNIYESDISSAIRPSLLSFALVGIAVECILGLAIAKATNKDRKNIGVITQAVFRSNFTVMGLPIASAFVNGEDLSSVAVLVAVVIPLFNVLAVVVLNVFAGSRPDYRKTVFGILKNPLIIATAIGLVFSAAGISFPSPLKKAVSQMSSAATPLTLVLLGAFFRFNRIDRHRKNLILICICRLVVMPGILLSAAYFLGLRGVEFAACVALFATSSSVASFTMTEQIGGNAELAANSVVFTSALSVFTIFLWCLLFKNLGAF